MKVLTHIIFVTAALLLCLGLPALVYLPRSGVDAVSSASLEVPDRPSGEFVVIVNRDRHAALDQWADFFTERPVGVIMEDVDCLVPAGDEAGALLAERCQARLAENQMDIRQENGLLVVSRAEHGLFDVIILSREAAEAYDYSAVYSRPDAMVLTLEGGT